MRYCETEQIGILIFYFPGLNCYYECKKFEIYYSLRVIYGFNIPESEVLSYTVIIAVVSGRELWN